MLGAGQLRVQKMNVIDVYEINHIRTAEKSDPRSYERNLRNWVRSLKKIQDFWNFVERSVIITIYSRCI